MYEAVFNAMPTDRPVSLLDRTPANLKFSNLMTEIWMVGKELLMSGQWKGLSEDLIKELCSRRYGDNNGRDAQGRIELEETRKQKKRLGKSPDLANAALIGLQVARVRYGLMASAKPAKLLKENPSNESPYDWTPLMPANKGRGLSKLKARFANLLHNAASRLEN